MTHSIDYNKNPYTYTENDVYWNDDDDYQEPIKEVFTSSKQKRIKRSELNKEINNKKDYIRDMIHSKLGNSIMLNKVRPTKKPPVLQRFEYGLREYFFGRNGLVLDYFPMLRYRMMLEDKRRKRRVFDMKIHTGDLVYLNYQTEGNRFAQRMVDIKRRALANSDHFDLKKKSISIHNISRTGYATTYTLPNMKLKGNQTGISNMKFNGRNSKISPTRNTNISNATAYVPNMKMMEYLKCNTTPSHNTLNNNTNITTTYNNNDISTTSITPFPYSNKNLKAFSLKQKYIKKRNHSRSIRKESSIQDYGTMTINTNTNNHHNQTTISLKDLLNQSKMIKKKIIIKANTFNIKQMKLEKQLFKIIDQAQTTHNDKIFVDKDIEAIFGTKVKRKKTTGQTKDLYFKAVKVRNDLRCMESNKAELIRLSDTINNMTDEMALGLADRLVEEYWKKSLKAKVDFVQVPELIKKKRELQATQLRARISSNNLKLVQKKHELIHQKNQLLEILNQELSISPNNKNNSPF